MKPSDKNYRNFIPENLLTRENGPGLLMMPDGSSYSRDCAQTGLNNNIAVIGPSGAGKTTIMASLNLINANSSFIISDPKGTLYRTFKSSLEDLNYNVLKLDLCHPECSSKFNPLAGISSSKEIRRLAHTIVYDNSLGIVNNDPYWQQEAERMLCALIAYVLESDHPISQKNLVTVMKLVTDIEALDDLDDRKSSPVFSHFKTHNRAMQQRGLESWAYLMFKSYYSLAPKTLSCVVGTLNACLTAFTGEELEKMLTGNDFDFGMLGEEKTAIFVIVSDSDRSMDILANLFYSTALNKLCEYADNECKDGSLPIAVTFLLDDFATNCRINNFENSISNIRARNISAIIMLQSISQLDAGYQDSSQTILNNCDTLIFMGANSLVDAEHFATRANKPLHTMLEMTLHSSWIFRRGQKPRFVRNIDPRGYINEVELVIEEEINHYMQEEYDYYCDQALGNFFDYNDGELATMNKESRIAV